MYTYSCTANGYYLDLWRFINLLIIIKCIIIKHHHYAASVRVSYNNSARVGDVMLQ